MANPKGLSVRTDIDGNILYPVVLPTTAATAHAATADVTSSIANGNHTNTGASGAIVLTLPSATTMPNKAFRLYQTVAQQTSLSPIATEGIYLAGSGVVNKDLVLAGTIGNYVDVYSDGTNYHVVAWSGVLTKEA